MKPVQTILLAFQVCLGLWQFVKLTPVGGLVQGGIGWLLSLLPFRLSPAYARLQHLPGRVFKKVHCAVLTKAPGLHDELVALASVPSGERSEIIQLHYLREDFRLERREGNKLFINEKMSYYITDAMWQNLLVMGILARINCVFLKGYKDFWELVVTGGVMPFSEALDYIILENHTIMFSDNDWLLPVNLSLPEEKLIKLLNLVGLFLQTKKVFWLIPALLSFVSAMLEFNRRLRAWFYRTISKVLCWLLHLICDKLGYSKRRQVYCLGKWVENLRPCNDIELKVVTGDICAVIAGGAKANKGNAALVPWLNVEEGETEKIFACHDPIVMKCWFSENDNRCEVSVEYSDDLVAVAVVDCTTRAEFMKMCTLVDCMAKKRSGSLKSYDGHNKVEVRGWKESVRHYAKSGYPDIYEFKLEHVIVNGI